MKRFFTLTIMALLLGITAGSAQTLRKTWDFRNGFSQKTVNALAADQEEFGNDKYWRNYEGDATKADDQHFWCASKDAKNATGFACTHNGGQEKVIPELEGLTLGFTAAKKFVITYNGATAPNEFESEGGPALGEPIPHGNSYIWLNGKNETIKFSAAVNQTIKIGVESHAVNRSKLGEARGISLTTSAGSLTLTKGNAVPTYYTECEWELTGDEGTIAELTIKSTNGCHIYYIIVGEGDDPNANKTKVAYITDGDATEETAYQALSTMENTVVTAIDAATLTIDKLQEYHTTVVSPKLSADNAAVSVLKEAIAFVPMLNLNASLYEAWGLGQLPETDLPIAIIANEASPLLTGIEFLNEDEMGNYIQPTETSEVQGINLGEYFADDNIVLKGYTTEAVLSHVHNLYHNAYIYLIWADDANDALKQVLFNAIDVLKDSKSEVTQAPAPKITLNYKNLNTIISLSMASSSLPQPQIFYTLDGTEPTVHSTLYTEPITVTEETVVKAVALADGYLLSAVAEAKTEIFSQPATPVIATTYNDGQTIVTLSCETEGVDIWYNYNSVVNDTTKSMKYTEPLTFALPTDFTAFAVAGQQVYSEPAQQRIVVKNVVVRQDQIGLFDANSADWQNGGGSTVYYFSWGKNAASIYDTTQEGTTTTDPETGDEITVYPERDYSFYVPSDEADWEVKSKGQVMIWQSLSTGSDPGNDGGYNPETAGDIISYAKIINNDIQFGGKTSGEPCTGAIQSRKTWAGPFDVVTHVGTAAGGDNVGRMQVQISKDSITWENLGDEMVTSTVKRLWKSYTRSYEGTDEVYVRIVQNGGGSSVQIYDIYILNQGENSLAIKAQYDAEYEEFTQGITTVATTTSMPAGIYTLSGVRTDRMQQGLNIVVRADGTVQKILVK